MFDDIYNFSSINSLIESCINWPLFYSVFDPSSTKTVDNDILAVLFLASLPIPNLLSSVWLVYVLLVELELVI